MSSSDDDIPLGERKVLQKVTEPNDGKPSAATKHAAVAENASSDSDDDVPLAHKQIPKKGEKACYAAKYLILPQ